jgi:SAM-dependent methyltransferase
MDIEEENNRADTAAREKWREKYQKFDEKRATYDGWLDIFDRAIEHCDTPIIDLGCGNGNNARYLSQRGKEVIACDYTQKALDLIKENMPEVAKTLCFDMRDDFPFDDNFTRLIVADLSLHYFTEVDTIRIVNEIKRILRPNGILLMRLNSVNDINYGSRDGIELSKNYRRTEWDGDKRYFDEADIDRFFKEFDFIYKNEERMTERYEKGAKVLWRCALKVNKT